VAQVVVYLSSKHEACKKRRKRRRSTVLNKQKVEISKNCPPPNELINKCDFSYNEILSDHKKNEALTHPTT
jgi:hypothetical protein